MKKITALFLIISLVSQGAFAAWNPNTPPSPTNGMPVSMTTAGYNPTYRAQISDATVAATATDVMTICGSATKTVYVNYVQATADATGTGVQDFYLIKRTAADTGGTASAVAVAQMDSADAAPTATVKQYSANPSALGTGIIVAADHYALPAATSTGYPMTPWIEMFGVRNDEALALHGVNECLAFSLNGNAIAASLSLYTGIGWSEF